MAKVIEFYIPVSFRKRMTSVLGSQRGKLIEFRPPVRKAAWGAARCHHRRTGYEAVRLTLEIAKSPRREVPTVNNAIQ